MTGFCLNIYMHAIYYHRIPQLSLSVSYISDTTVSWARGRLLLLLLLTYPHRRHLASHVYLPRRLDLPLLIKLQSGGLRSIPRSSIPSLWL